VLSSDQKRATSESDETSSLWMFVAKQFCSQPCSLCFFDDHLAFEDRRPNLNTNNVRHVQTVTDSEIRAVFAAAQTVPGATPRSGGERRLKKRPKLITKFAKTRSVRGPAHCTERLGLCCNSGERCVTEGGNQAGVTAPKSTRLHLVTQIADCSLDQRLNPLAEPVGLVRIEPIHLAEQSKEGRAANRRSKHRSNNRVDALEGVIGCGADSGVNHDEQLGRNGIEHTIDQSILRREPIENGLLSDADLSRDFIQ
jgi:hypothetical protein